MGRFFFSHELHEFTRIFMARIFLCVTLCSLRLCAGKITHISQSHIAYL